MANATQLIQYLRGCYEADNRETVVENLFHPRYRRLRFFTGQEVALAGTLPRIMLPREEGEQLRREAWRYRRERTLLYGGLMLVGQSDFSLDNEQAEAQTGDAGEFSRKRERASGRTTICGPLAMLRCDVGEHAGHVCLEPHFHDLRINIPLLLRLAKHSSADEDQLPEVLGDLPGLPWTREQVHVLAARLADYLPEVDFSPLGSFPELADEREIQDYLQSGKPALQCLPAAAMVMLPNSPDTRGVLHELWQLSQIQSLSPPLKQLLEGRTPLKRELGASVRRWLLSARMLGNRPTSVQGRGRVTATVPAVLSSPQHRIVNSARMANIALAIGPPGTGKSYTIASMVLDHLARGQTVLVASRMDQAVDVVANKLREMIGSNQSMVRAGRREYMREMQQSLQSLLQGMFQPPNHERDSRYWLREVARSDRAIRLIERQLEGHFEDQIQWARLELEPSAGWLRSFMESQRRRILTARLDRPSASGWRMMARYQHLLQQRVKQAGNALQALTAERLARLLSQRRDKLTIFLQAVRARSQGRQQQLFNEIDFSVLLSAFPVWLCKLSDLSNVLPLREQLFDLVILDEASQCDIASCLPLLQRGRRAVIVGDPHQLRHVSFLPVTRQQRLAHQMELDELQSEAFDYRRRSILDLASGQITDARRVVMLNEHYRSLPHIIQFSNYNFYRDALHIMRGHPDTVGSQAVQVVQAGGTREPTGRNPIEAERLVDQVIRQVRLSADQPDTLVPQIGILSPFRQQSNLLWSLIADQLTHAEMVRHNILVGTAHAFQGEERDQMYLSLVADDRSHWATFRFLESPNLLNVTITRARHEQWIFLSFHPTILSSDSLIRRYLEYAARPLPEPQKFGIEEFCSFQQELSAALQARGLRVWPGYPLGGLTMDLVVETTEQPVVAVGVDLIGFPGDFESAFSLERYRMLYRAGLPILPISFRDWTLNPEECLATITNRLGSQKKF